MEITVLDIQILKALHREVKEVSNLIAEMTAPYKALQQATKWLDQQGSYMATIAAGFVFKLLGVKDLGVTNDYMTEKMPPMLTDMLDGNLAWRQHEGGHTDAPNFKSFIPWATKFLGYQKVNVQ